VGLLDCAVATRGRGQVSRTSVRGGVGAADADDGGIELPGGRIDGSFWLLAPRGDGWRRNVLHVTGIDLVFDRAVVGSEGIASLIPPR